MFEALSNPHRLHIFTRLVSRCTPGVSTYDMRCCVGDISETLEIALSADSHHMKEQQLAGLILMERERPEDRLLRHSKMLRETHGHWLPWNHQTTQQYLALSA